ncbi:sulfotransferase family protein [Catalinimonas niigatensis]|uniref:sulfotransferase family protein n=1 Tax=Catalinimonas niigatensis TaxID=1397264 RepID=UPI0026657FD6|nr:sulfotransferase [Catalinimonas niigatensis]WPP52616.1 sulfotransferase [Catalinimonas niigatensis]
MHKKAILKSVFIVGSPRSGTTLLQSILGTHPDFHTFPESHFFYSLYGSSRLRRRLGLVDRVRAHKALEAFLNNIDAAELKSEIPNSAWYERKWILTFKNILGQIAKEQHKRGWIEKTPMHLHFISQISKYIPESKFIHIVRDGKDTIASVYYYASQYPEQWGRNKSLESCIGRWKLDIKIHQRYLSKNNHCFVKYNTLVDNPGKEIKKICNFLSIDFQENMLLRRNTGKIILKKEFWKQTVGRDITIQSGKLSLLKEEEQSLIQKSVAAYPLDILFV